MVAARGLVSLSLLCVVCLAAAASGSEGQNAELPRGGASDGPSHGGLVSESFGGSAAVSGSSWRAAAGDTLTFRPGLVTVSFDTTLTHTEIDTIVARFPGVSVFRRTGWNWFDLRFSEEDDPHEYVALFLATDGVLDATPAYLGRLDATPNDYHYASQWAFHNTGQTGGTTDADIDAPEAWETETGDTTVVIAIIDSGLDLDHGDLEDNVWINWAEYYGTADYDDDSNGFTDDVYGWNFYDMDNDPNHQAGDESCHGSHVGGIAAAKTNNGTGVAGLAGGWGSDRSTGAKLMVLRVSHPGWVDLSAIDDAVQYAVDNGADIVNMSFSGHDIPGFGSVGSAANYAWSNDVLLISTTGTAGCTSYLCNYYDRPQSHEKVMAVGATDYDDDLASYSCCVDRLNLVAPGGDGEYDSGKIHSTICAGGAGGYAYKKGTSMAAPQVAGAAALALSADSGLSNIDLWQLLESSVDTIGSSGSGWDDEFGWGRLNAATALKGVEYQENSRYSYGEATCAVFCPGGDADTFRVTVTANDGDDDPVSGIAKHAVWLASSEPKFKVCCSDEDVPDCVVDYRRAYADTATDASGETVIELCRAGGAAERVPVDVFLYGLEVAGDGLLQLYDFLSHDINGDCVVDDDDLDILELWMSKYNWRGDFDCDGDVDSLDYALLEAHEGHSCSRSQAATAGSAVSHSAGTPLRVHPNPTRGGASISYQVASSQSAFAVRVYHVSGRLVRTLVDEATAAGQFRVDWDGKDEAGRPVASGVYFVRSESGGSPGCGKILVLR